MQRIAHVDSREQERKYRKAKVCQIQLNCRKSSQLSSLATDSDSYRRSIATQRPYRLHRDLASERTRARHLNGTLAIFRVADTPLPSELSSDSPHIDPTELLCKPLGSAESCGGLTFLFELTIIGSTPVVILGLVPEEWYSLGGGRLRLVPR